MEVPALELPAGLVDALDAALESLRRQRFYEQMASAENQLRSDPVAWAACVATHATAE